jgi:hypothetical protein
VSDPIPQHLGEAAGQLRRQFREFDHDVTVLLDQVLKVREIQRAVKANPELVTRRVGYVLNFLDAFNKPQLNQSASKICYHKASPRICWG